MNIRLSENLFGFDDPDTTGQRVFRNVLELFIVVATCYLVWKWGRYTLRISDVVLPLGIGRYLDMSFMHGNALPLINAGLITLLVILGFFRFGRWPYALAFALMLFQYAARFSLGEIPHSANLIGMGLLGFALGAIVYSDKVHSSRFGTGFTYFFVGLAYTLAAWSKLIGTGITWPDGRHLWMWINEKAVDEIARSGFVELNGIQEIALSSLTVATLFLAFGLIAEFFAFLVWFKRFRTPVFMAILMLHIGIHLTMDILFFLSVYEVIILGLPWAAWIDRGIASRQPSLTPM